MPHKKKEIMMASTYNDSSNWVDPIYNIIGEKCSNKADDIGDHIEEMVLCISLNNFICE